MRLKTVKTFARTMLAIDRLVVAGSTGPRSSISRAASASERPWSDRLAGGGTRVSVTSATLARARHATRPVRAAAVTGERREAARSHARAGAAAAPVSGAGPRTWSGRRLRSRNDLESARGAGTGLA